jgi:hypothetical protein
MDTSQRHPARPYLGDLRALAEDAISRSADPDERIAVLHEAAMIERRAREAVQLLVAQAREAGATWAEVGEYFGTTRQAAQQRFGAPRI